MSEMSDWCYLRKPQLYVLGNSTCSQTYKVANNGINANFLLPYFCRFLHYLDLKKCSKCEIRCQLLKGITFQGCRL